MSFTSEELQYEISKRRIYLEEGIKYTNPLLVKRLGDEYLKNHRDELSFGVSYVQYIDNFMLCKHLKDEAKNFDDYTNPLTSPDWIAEVKKDDFRSMVVFDPDYGFEIFSRRESVKTFLNNRFTDKLLFIQNGLIREPQDYKGTFNYRFILDCGITVGSGNMILDGVEYSNAEDLLQSLLGGGGERSKNLQKKGYSLVFNGFDVLWFEENPQPIAREDLFKFMYGEKEVTPDDVKWIQSYFKNYLLTSGFVDKNGAPMPLNNKTKKLYLYLASLRDTDKRDLRKLPFYKRRKIRDSIISFLQHNNLPFLHIDSEDVEKISFADQLIRDGGEGIILKSLNAPYISSLASSRSHKAMLKVKTSISQLLTNMDVHDDFDCYIVGSNPPRSKRVEDMIGAIKCAIYLEDGEGNVVEHEIANVAGIPHDVKRAMTIIDDNGVPTLNPEYLGKVIAINGMNLSHLNMRFSHAVLKDKDPDRLITKDKSPKDCCYLKSDLESMVSVRGTR